MIDDEMQSRRFEAAPSAAPGADNNDGRVNWQGRSLAPCQSASLPRRRAGQGRWQVERDHGGRMSPLKVAGPHLQAEFGRHVGRSSREASKADLPKQRGQQQRREARSGPSEWRSMQKSFKNARKGGARGSERTAGARAHDNSRKSMGQPCDRRCVDSPWSSPIAKRFLPRPGQKFGDGNDTARIKLPGVEKSPRRAATYWACRRRSRRAACSSGTPSCRLAM